MARARTIKPAFFSSDQVAACSHPARLLFIGLWCLADRDGKLLDRPVRIRAELFPYESGLDADALLSEIERAGLIVRYESDGTRILKITGFGKHQNPHPKESASELPEPCNYTASHGKVLASNAVSLLPITHSPLPSTAPEEPPEPKKERNPLFDPAKAMLMAVFKEKRQTDYAWSRECATGLKWILSQTQDLAEIERRWRIALDSQYPVIGAVLKFRYKWNDCAVGTVSSKVTTNVNAPAGIGTQWGKAPF